jgi:hypothetical protein
MRTSETKSQPSVETADLDAASFLYAQDVVLLSHRHDGSRTVFTFRASPEQVARYYGPSGEAARKLLLARRTLLGLVHEGRR